MGVTFFIPLPVSAAQEPEIVRVGYFIHDGYQNKAEDGTYSGYGYDYLQEIAQYANIQYEYVEGSWTDCLQWLRDGKIDMVGFMLKTDEREKVYDFPVWNCGYNTSKLLTLKDNTAFAENAWNDFDGIRIGCVENSQIIQQFAQLAEEHGFHYTQKLYATQEDVTNALKSGEVDAICVSNVIIPEWTRVLSIFNPQPIYYAVTKGNTELLNQLNDAIGEIKSTEPTFEQSLRSKYYQDNRSQTVVLSQAEKDFVASSKPIVVAIDPDLMPIEGVDSKTGQAAGFTVELLSKISQLSGLRFTYQINDSYAAAMKSFQQGNCDILSGVNQSFADFDDCVLSDIWLRGSFVLVGNQTYTAELSHPLKISFVPRAAFLKGYIETLFPNAELVPYDNAEAALAAVDAKTVDLTLINIYTFQTQKFLEYPKLHIIQDTGYLSEYHFAYHEDAPEELVSILNKCISSISESENNSMLTAAISSSMEKDNLSWKTLAATLAAILALAGAVFLLIRLRKSRKHLVRLAYYDELTGASNVTKFAMDARTLIHQNTQLSYTIRVFDISNFRMFNDFYGFEEGNVLLCGVVSALQEILDKKTETLGRIHADQFVTLTTDVTPEGFACRINAFRERFFPNVSHQAYKRVTFKTGCYILEKGDEDVSGAIEKAMLAHKAAKLSDKTYVYYDETMKSEAQKRRAIESKMDAALADREFQLYLQPQYEIAHNRIAGMEALVRWQPKGGAMIFPNDFIPVFEKNGFVVKLDYEMFEQACKTLRFWLDHEIPTTTIAVNLSRLHLENENLIPELCAIADAYRVPHELLELELTETIAAENEASMSSLAKRVHDAGMHLSIDDFGSGYSSLGILKSIAFDTLKLDRSFFVGAADRGRSQVIIRSIVQMAKSLKITTIAEGIEEQQQIDFLRKIQCDVVQGYYYAKPMPVANATKLLAESHPEEPAR